MNVFKELMLTFTLGFIFSFWFGVQFGKAIEQRKKKKASSKNQQKISSRKSYQIKGGRSMANINVGDIVHASDTFHGSYVGKVVSFRTTPVHIIQVQILACISYPRQHAEFFRDKPAERFPYKHYSVQNFTYGSIGKYVGKIPEYSRSVQNAINNAIKKCLPVELPILLKHCNRKAGDHICVG